MDKFLKSEMMLTKCLVFLLFAKLILCINNAEFDLKQPTIVISILVRNKAHTLPYFLTFLENLNYPKSRITLWIRSDNNIDNSIEILKTWLKETEEQYHFVDSLFDKKSQGFSDEKEPSDWTPKRFVHVMKLREEALNFARKIWADYIFMLDADVLLTNPETLGNLVSKNLTVAAPLLKSDGMYSNFWAGMTSDYYYVRTERYKPILNREETGCLKVPMIHSAVLIDLRRTISDLLTYRSENVLDYDGPDDDIITFALVANKSDISLHICNNETYGFVMVPLEDQDTFDQDKQQLINLKLEILNEREYVPLMESLERFVEHPKRDTLGVSQIYMINLLRRPKRRRRMLRCFEELGIEAEIVDAIDGSTLNESALEKWGIKIMPNYIDPYHKRPMTMGEIGCFLSHYIIWNKIVENGYKNVIVLEDDIRFEPYFRQKVRFVLTELERLNIDWDLVYLGRKRMQEQDEPWVVGSRYLVHAGYSYWTLGYMLSAKGARKLLRARPLDNMVPVDEYLPILFDKHPRDTWKGYFPQRDLIALSTAPLLIYPTHYTGESGYVSDTEDSKIIFFEESQIREEL